MIIINNGVNPTTVLTPDGILKVIEVTDIEGRQKFLINIFSNEVNTGLKILDEKGQEKKLPISLDGTERIMIPDGHVLVFNGDLFDHGPDDIKLAQIFERSAQYYEQYNQPEKLQIIVGNRDSNKLRLAWELNQDSIIARIINNDTPSWTPIQLTFAEHILELIYKSEASEDLRVFFRKDLVKKLKVLLPENLSGLTGDENKVQFEQTIKDAVRQSHNKELLRKLILQCTNNMAVTDRNNNPLGGLAQDRKELVYLKWMLKNTLGCGYEPLFNGSTFMHRQKELQEIAYKEDPTKIVTPLDVLQHFKNAIAENGIYYNILKRGKIAVTIDDTLYIHGGLTPKSTIINGKDYKNDFYGWLAAINKNFFKYRNEIFNNKFNKKLPVVTNDAIRTGIDNGEAGLSHLEDNIPIDARGEWLEVLTQNNATGSTITQFFIQNPQNKSWTPHVAVEILAFLKQGGIKRVILGHMPIGNSPIGTQFVMDGITFVYTDITRVDNQNFATCFAITTHHLGQSSLETVAIIPEINKTLTITGAAPVVLFKQAIEGIAVGPNTTVRTKDGGIVFVSRVGFKATVKYFSKESLQINAMRLVAVLAEPPKVYDEFNRAKPGKQIELLADPWFKALYKNGLHSIEKEPVGKSPAE